MHGTERRRILWLCRRYYLDPERHPDRKYIGVVFEKEGKLPTPKNAPTRRKLNRVAVRFEPEEELAAKQGDLVAKIGEEGTQVGSATKVEAAQAAVQLRPGYMYREANWSIGRAAEKAGTSGTNAQLEQARREEEKHERC